MVKQHPERQSDSPRQTQLRQPLPEPDLPPQASRSGLDGVTREGALGVRSEPQPDTLIDLFGQEYHGAGHLAIAEELEATGLFDELEQAGVLPTTPDPNPFDDELEGAQPEQWWEEHPEKRDELLRTLGQRDQALRHLYIGAILGHLFGPGSNQICEARSKAFLQRFHQTTKKTRLPLKPRKNQKSQNSIIRWADSVV